MKALASLRDPGVIATLARDIAAQDLKRPVRLMEVCGGHTAAIYRYGLRSLLPEWVTLLTGPGCPVCVTANDFVDRAVALARLPDATLATFGDLVRVPGSTRSLADLRSQGADVRVFYSSADALSWAEEHPKRTVIFMGIGFETTACTLAATMAQAVQKGTRNFRFLSALKTMPRALRALLSSPESRIDGFILPGHVTTITGTAIYEFITQEFRVPCVVSGFEPADLLETVLMLCRQIGEGRADVEIQYRRVVRTGGNARALELMARMFEPCDVSWRGFGVIPESGLQLKPQFFEWDARGIEVEPEPLREHIGCRCGDVLRGVVHPRECPLFGSVCTPETPRGACMVSSEGACAAVYQFAESGEL